MTLMGGDGVLGAQLALVQFGGDRFTDPIYLSLPDVPDDVYPVMTLFHPGRMVLAALLARQNEVRFFELNVQEGRPVLAVAYIWSCPSSIRIKSGGNDAEH